MQISSHSFPLDPIKKPSHIWWGLRLFSKMYKLSGNIQLENLLFEITINTVSRGFHLLSTRLQTKPWTIHSSPEKYNFYIPTTKRKTKPTTHTQPSRPPWKNKQKKPPIFFQTIWSSVAFPHGNRELWFQITNATMTQGISNIPHASTQVANSHGNCGPARITWQPCLPFLICLLSTFQTSSLKEVHIE